MLDSTTSSDAVVRAMRAAGVPPIYLGAEPRPDLIGGAYLMGKSGVGKTHAACGAIRAFVDTHIHEVEGMEVYVGPRAKFVNVPDWFSEMRATYDQRGQSEREVFERYAGCGLLVLDDLGKGNGSEWAVERVYLLLDRRCSSGLPTIITSNYDLGELVARLGTDRQSMEAIASRIGGMCRGIKVDGPDRRLQKN